MPEVSYWRVVMESVWPLSSHRRLPAILSHTPAVLSYEPDTT